MSARTERSGIVAFVAALDGGYTSPAVGDQVKITDDYTVAACEDGDVAVGVVINVQAATGSTVAQVTVESRSAKIRACLASEAISAGGCVVPVSATKVRAYVPGTDDPQIVGGVALIAATADDDPMEYLVL